MKFWLSDGRLVKYEYHVQGTMTFGGNDVDIDRATTVEIKDVGKTKLEIPEEAKEKVDGPDDTILGSLPPVIQSKRRLLCRVRVPCALPPAYDGTI